MTNLTGSRRTAGIIGAGVSGLTAACRLAEKGWKVRIFESQPVIGGLARMEPFLDFQVERYYHFICRYDKSLLNLINHLGLSDLLKWRRTAMDYHVHGHLYPFTDLKDLLTFAPLSYLERLRFGISMKPFQISWNWQHLDEVPNDKWLIRWGGNAVYRNIWYPLMMKKYHSAHRDVPAAWVWGRTRRRSRSRFGFPGHEYLGYLEGMMRVMLKRMEEITLQHEGSIHLSEPVIGLKKDGQGLVIETDKDRYCFDRVISTLPAPLLAGIAPSLPEDFVKRLNSVEYLAVISPVLASEGYVAKNYWTNIHSVEIPYLGVIEYSLLNPEPAFKGLTIDYMPFYLWQDHPLWQASDSEILGIVLKHLKELYPWFNPSSVRHHAIFRDRFSQPMIRTGHLKQILTYQTPWTNLFMMEPSMIYPEDRGLNNCIRHIEKLTDNF